MAERVEAPVILFDFFGTLVTYEADRTVIRYDRTHELLVGWGVALSHEEFVATWDAASTAVELASGDEHVETTMTEVALAFAARVSLDLDEGRCGQLIEVFLDEWAAPIEPVPGASEMLRRLAEQHRLGVVSNTHDPDMVGRLLDRFDMATAFEHVLLSVDHGRRKPHPSIYVAALERFRAEPADAVFVGDTYPADYLGPTGAGLHAFLIDPDRVHPDVLDAHHLDSVLDLERALMSGSPRSAHRTDTCCVSAGGARRRWRAGRGSARGYRDRGSPNARR